MRAALLVIGVVVLGFSGTATAGPPSCAPVTATIYGSYGADPARATGERAWVGRALLSVDGGAVEQATFVDRNNTLKPPASTGAPFSGTETIAFKLAAGTFDVAATFEAKPGFAPGFYTLYETGQIANGTGAFAGASGDVTVEGPFLFPSFDAPPWIAQMRGQLCATSR